MRGKGMLNKAGMVCAALLLLTSAGWPQDDSRLNLAVSLGEAFSKQSSGNGVVLSPTNNVEVFGTARLRIAKKSSIELTIGKLSNSQKYNSPQFTFSIPTSITEVTGAFVYSPFAIKKFEPFLLAGAGALRFYPSYYAYVSNVLVPLNSQNQTRPAFLYGFGFDYRAYWKFAVRLQYRGLFYQAPDFSVPGLTTSAKGHLAEPSVGLVFRF
jgi:opacity protein-like surface antigen